MSRKLTYILEGVKNILNSKKVDIKIFFLFALYYILFLFYIDNQIIFLILNFVFILTLLFLFNRIFKKDIFSIFFSIFIVSIPISFQNIIGTAYGQLPISLYNISALILFFIIVIIYKNKFKLDILSIISSILLLFLLLSVFISANIHEGFKQIVNYIVFYLLIIIWSNVNTNVYKIGEYKKIYVYSTLATGCAVILQAVLFQNGISIGNIIQFGGNRTAIGYLFSDYSFLSLYLISPIFFVLNGKYKNSGKIIIIIILTFSSVITSARTGIIALGIVLILYILIFTLKNINKRPHIVFLMWIVIIAMISAMVKVVNSFRQEGIIADSGRLEGYKYAIEKWYESPLVGFGFDLTFFATELGITIPHNFVIQMLVQGGLIYALLVLLLVILILIKVYNHCKHDIWPLITVLVGAQFIPDIIESRFFLILVLLLILNTKKYQNASVLEEPQNKC